jgi:CubicO group peptidase (beta-lactamase class C family)
LKYFPEYNARDSDKRKSRITLKHLLTMSAGFEWDELTFDAEKSAIVHDWFFGGKRAALYDALPRDLAHEPGTHFNYDSPVADLISVILTRAADQDLRSFAVEHLFGPLGITDFEWEIDPAGFYRGSAGLIMRPRDVAKIGQLYLQKGQWQQYQILPPAWVEESILAHVTLGEGAGYGLLWWVSERDQLRFFSAVGYGGQLLLVVPAQQLVVVAQHQWLLPAEAAVKNSTDFYNEVFLKIVEHPTSSPT